jgi:flagellar basal-body rod protein FlgB
VQWLQGKLRTDICEAGMMQVVTQMTEELGRYLDLSSLELKLTAQNMANVDTPGYRTVGFDFVSEMQRSLESLSQEASGAAGAENPGVAVGPVGGLLERPDGNDVSMDREGMKMAGAQLRFRTGVELLKHEFTRVLDAIHEDQK